MAAKKRNTEQVQSAPEVAEPESVEEQDLYQSEVSRYMDTLDRGLDEALERYGFTLFHSLPPSRQVELSKELGLLRYDAIDYYNLAGLEVERGQFEAAVQHYQKALELDGTLADAAFNLALALERLDRKSEAINAWSRFLELTQSDDERRDVEAHLAELKA